MINIKKNIPSSTSVSSNRLDSTGNYFWHNFSEILKRGSANSCWNIYLWYPYND